MGVGPMSGPDRIAVVDPSDFTTPYDWRSPGHTIPRSSGMPGGPGRRLPGSRAASLWPFLSSPRLAAGTAVFRPGVRMVKGACHGFDMLRLARWMADYNAGIAHFQWSPIPVIDRRVIRLLQHRRPVVLTLHDSNPYQGGESWLMRQAMANCCAAVDAVIVHTQQAQSRVVAMGVDPAVICRIPHGLLAEAGHRRTPPRAALRRDRLVLLQFGEI